MDMKFMNIADQQAPATAQSHQSKPLTPFEKKAKETAVSFEAVFLSQILKSMSMGLKSDGPFSGGHSEEIFQDVLSEEMGKHIAKNGGIGLSDAVYKEILKTQEVGYSNVK